MPDEGGPGPPMTVAAAAFPPIPVAGLPLTWLPPPPTVAGAMTVVLDLNFWVKFNENFNEDLFLGKSLMKT